MERRAGHRRNRNGAVSLESCQAYAATTRVMMVMRSAGALANRSKTNRQG